MTPAPRLRRGLLSTCPLILALIASSLSATLPVEAAVNPGDILLVVVGAGTDGTEALVRVDPTTGIRVMLSDFGDESQGPIAAGSRAVAIEASGQILLLNGWVFRVDPSTGQRTIVTDIANPALGPPTIGGVGIAVESSGQILAVMLNGSDPSTTDYIYALGRVHPTTGVRTILSNFGDSSKGPLVRSPAWIAVEASGTILVTSSDDGTSRHGALIRVDPATGVRTMLSDFGDISQGPLGEIENFARPIRGVAVQASGQIVVADELAGTFADPWGARGALFRVDPVTGYRTRFSDWGQGALVGEAQGPVEVAVEATGRILATDARFPNSLYRVDTGTGALTLLSALGDTAQGPRGPGSLGMAVVPNTPRGSNVVSRPRDSATDVQPITITFSNVTQPGNTSLTTTASAPPIPSGFKLGTPTTFYDITTTATFSGNAQVCIDYTGINVGNESKLKLFHYENGHWRNATTSLNTATNIICGSVGSFSPFAVLEEDKVPYAFTGFFSPVDNPPTVNTGKAGSSVPVKFSLGGPQGLAIFEPGYPQSQAISCTTTGPVDALEATATPGASTLTYDASTDRYTYVWKTEKGWAGTCRQLLIKLNDGTARMATFKFTK